MSDANKKQKTECLLYRDIVHTLEGVVLSLDGLELQITMYVRVF